MSDIIDEEENKMLTLEKLESKIHIKIPYTEYIGVQNIFEQPDAEDDEEDYIDCMVDNKQHGKMIWFQKFTYLQRPIWRNGMRT